MRYLGGQRQTRFVTRFMPVIESIRTKEENSERANKATLTTWTFQRGKQMEEEKMKKEEKEEEIEEKEEEMSGEEEMEEVVEEEMSEEEK